MLSGAGCLFTGICFSIIFLIVNGIMLGIKSYIKEDVLPYITPETTTIDLIVV